MIKRNWDHVGLAEPATGADPISMDVRFGHLPACSLGGDLASHSLLRLVSYAAGSPAGNHPAPW